MPANEEAATDGNNKDSGTNVSTTSEPKGTWRDEEEQVLPKNNIPLVFFALLLTTFLVRDMLKSQ